MSQRKISTFFTSRLLSTSIAVPSAATISSSICSPPTATFTSCESIASDEADGDNINQNDTVAITNSAADTVTDGISNKCSSSDRCYRKIWEKTFTWLYEDKVRGGAFCKLCEMYVKNDQKLLQSSGGVFIITPFINYKKALGKDGRFLKHAKSESHARSVEMETLRLQGKNKPIHTQILNQSEQERNRNRKSLCLLLHSVYFLAKEEIAHTTKYEPIVDRVLRRANADLDEWIRSQSERSTYVSRNTASELVSSIGEVLKEIQIDKLLNKKFALMADESTSVQNISELSICVRYVDNGSPVECFVGICSLPDTKAETITRAIDKELKVMKLSYDNLVACGFDGAANMSGNKGGVRRLLSNKANRDIPYIHCRAHILSLALTSMRNSNVKIKRVLHVLKDIYKLFHMSPKREAVLHNIQAMLNDPILKIPEAIDIRWLSHYKIVHAVLVSYVPIMTTCEHIHKDGADLASLAGGILLELQNQSFLITLCGLDEALCAVSNLSLTLQKSGLCASVLPTMIDASLAHLTSISRSCSTDDENTNSIIKRVNAIKNKAVTLRPVIQDEPSVASLKNVKSFVDGMIREMSRRFNDKAIALIKGCALFETYASLTKASEEDIKDLCTCLAGNGLDIDAVQSDFTSFVYYASSKIKEDNPGYPLTHLQQVEVGYAHLKKLAEMILCIPVATAGVERSFSSMNRILTKLRNRMGEDTLDHCMRISIEGQEKPSEEFINRVLDNYARKKPRRIRLL